MKTIKTFGVALVAMLMLGAVSASGAVAYEWQFNGSAITEAKSVSWTSTIKFENEAEHYTLHCAIVHKGTVGPGAKSEITSITSTGGAQAIPCELSPSSTACESGAEIEALGLPWTSELGKTGSEVRNALTKSEKDEWKIKCKGSVPTNWCAVSPSTAVYNVNAGVEEIYEETRGTKCFETGGTSLYTSGREVPIASGGTLSIAPLEPEWLLGGIALLSPASTEWKGTLKLTDRGWTSKGISVECEDTAGGPVGLRGLGEVTSWTASKCTGVENKCESAITFEAVNLPWHTALATVGGVTRDVFTSGGKGSPGYKWHCVVLFSKVTEECTATTLSASVTNVTEGVTAKY